MKKKGSIILILAVVLLAAWYATSAVASSATRGKAQGVLTSVEEDRTVVIDKKGYEVDSSARILDSQKRRIDLDELPLPVDVYFEYEFTERGPLIKLMRVTPQ